MRLMFCVLFLFGCCTAGNFTPVPKDSMITFLFIGHSNMSGHCAEMDLDTHPRVWFYKSSKGFFNGNDKSNSNHSGSPVLPFLKNMALRYPQYNFCGIKYGHACGQAFHIMTEEKHKQYFVNKIAEMKKISRIGGIMLMYGYIEGRYPESVQPFGNNLTMLIDSLRGMVGISDLPVIIGRYEVNGSLKEAEEYRQFDKQVINQIEYASKARKNVALSPIDYVPKEYYCDNHHYTAEGYKLLAEDACAIYQANGWLK